MSNKTSNNLWKEHDNRNNRQDLIKINIGQTFRIVNQMLLKLLVDIDKIYNRNGINYQVLQLEQTFLRLLIPYEIKGYLDSKGIDYKIQNKINFEKMLSTNHNVNKFQFLLNHCQNRNSFQNHQLALKYNNNCGYLEEQEKQQQGSCINHKETNNKNYKFIQTPNAFQNTLTTLPPPPKTRSTSIEQASLTRINPYNTSNRYNLKQKQQYLLKQSQNQIEYNLKTGQPLKKKGVRSRGLEQYLIGWIKDSHDNGQLIGRKDVMNLVKKLGSVGWYSNFISRNPEIRQLLKIGNNDQYGSKNIQRKFLEKQNDKEKDKDKQKKEEDSSDSQSAQEIRTNGIYEDEQDGFLDYEILGEGSDKNESSHYFYVKPVKTKEEDDSHQLEQFEQIPLSTADRSKQEVIENNTKIEKMQ